jgi:hypothetical protein
MYAQPQPLLHVALFLVHHDAVYATVIIVYAVQDAYLFPANVAQDV